MKPKVARQLNYMRWICAILILLWIYTSMSKLIDPAEFKRQLYNQVFSHRIADILFWFLPIIEIATALLLCFRKSQFAGLFLSFLLMLLFSGYVGLVLTGYFERRPCACGGVFKQLGWQLHFWFNLFFLTISSVGLWLSYQLRQFKESG